MVFAKVGKYATDNLGSILTGMAVGGSVMTVIFTAKGQLEADRIMAEDKSLDADATMRDILETRIRKTWQCYLPALFTLSGTIACIVGANNANLSKQAGLMASLAYTESKVQDIRRELGDEKFNKVQKTITEKQCNETEMPSENPKEGCAWYYEPESQQWFQATTEQILWAELTANKMFNNQNELTLNELLGLYPGCKKVPYGDSIGWYVYDDDGTWDFNWSFYRGAPWIDIQPVIISKTAKGNKFGREYLSLEYGMSPMDVKHEPMPED